MSGMRRVVISAVTIGAALAATAGLGVGTASAFGETTVTCHSENPYPWMPAFNYVLTVGTAFETYPPAPTQPLMFIDGLSDNRDLMAIPQLDPFVSYDVSTKVDWHNTTTGQSGSTTVDQSFRIPHAGASMQTGAGHVEFTSTQTTGAIRPFINSKVSVCKGATEVLPVP